ncbi:CHAD domain-containing protein [Labilibaculum sp.]|uniref:CHAD domain-containing protein n=1 Tax=Labilibaculum sp. TaxID=2060723 RepID=UPI0035674CAD
MQPEAKNMQSKKGNTRLSSFYKERFDSFLTNLNLSKNLNEESIHKLRVDIKNMRSLLLLVEEINLQTKLATKLIKQLRSIFRSTGKLRALQVSKSLLASSNISIPEQISLFLEEEIKNQSKKVSINFSKFNLPKFKKRVAILYSDLEQIEDSELLLKGDRIIHDELEIVNKLFNSSKGEEYHHEIRKLLKVVKTLENLLLVLSEDERRKQALEIVNTTETNLGNWHDHKSLADFLLRLEQKLSDASISRTLRNLNNQNNKAKLELKKEADKHLRNHF